MTKNLETYVKVGGVDCGLPAVELPSTTLTNSSPTSSIRSLPRELFSLIILSTEVRKFLSDLN